MNNNSPSFYYSNYLSDKSETYRKLEQLSNDVRNSWTNDCDETDSMKEIIEMINGMLVMTSLEDYFLNDKMDLEFFMGEFSKDVLYVFIRSIKNFFFEEGNTMPTKRQTHRNINPR